MLTADTITDEQIKALRSANEPDKRGSSYSAWRAAWTALGMNYDGSKRWGATPKEQRDARARCAEILNQRSKDAAHA